MARTKAKFTQADLSRAVRAAAGCATPMEVVLETDGRIRIVPARSAETVKKVDNFEPIRL